MAAGYEDVAAAYERYSSDVVIAEVLLIIFFRNFFVMFPFIIDTLFRLQFYGFAFHQST